MKFGEFKKSFVGDHKLNVVALDGDNEVLAHRAVTYSGTINSLVIRTILESLRDRVWFPEQIARYQFVFPNGVSSSVKP